MQSGEGLIRSEDHRLDYVSALVGHGLDSRPGEVCSPGPPRYAHYGAPGLGIPPGTSQAGERGHEVDAVVVGDLGGERPDVCRLCDQPETVA